MLLCRDCCDRSLARDVQRAHHVHGGPDCLVRFGTTDIVMDSGDGVPIYEVALHHAIFRLVDRDFSGYLMKNLTSLTEGTFSLSPQRGRLLVMSKRNRATLAWITTQSSNRLTTRRFASAPTRHHHCWCQMSPLRGGIFPAKFH